MVKILNINLIGGRTGTWGLIKTISEGLGENYNIHNLVGYCFGNNDNKTTSLYKTNNSKLYRNFRYKLAVGLNFLFDWMTPGCIDMKYLHNFKSYQYADIIHLHSIQGGFFDWNILPEISKEKKVIMTCHDDWIVSGNDKNTLFPYKTKKQYEKRKKIFLNSDITYVGVSNWMKNKVRDDGISGNNKVVTIYNGINTEIFRRGDKGTCRKELGLPLDKKIIISIAGAGQKSNLKGIIYVEKLRKELNDKEDLLFISIGNNEYKKISDKEIEVGFVDSKTMSKYFSASDLFLYPTLADSFGLVVVESIACGCPVVSFETGGVPEIVHDKENGYIAKYKDYEDLKRGFNWTLNNLDKLDVKLDKCFYQENMINGYKKLYHSLLTE